MTDEHVTLLAAAYAEQESAKTILNTLNDMHRGLTISLKDTVMISRGDDGKPKLHGGLGDKIGSLLESVHDTGIKQQDMQRIANQLQPGQVALLALVANDSVISTQSALEGFDGELIGPASSEAGIKASFEAEASNRTLTGQALETEPVPGSAGDTPVD